MIQCQDLIMKLHFKYFFKRNQMLWTMGTVEMINYQQFT